MARRWLSLRRAAANMKRGLTPSSQAERQRPEPVHDCAQRAPRVAASPPPQDVQYVAHDGCRLPRVDSGGTGGGTDLDATCAAGAAVEDFAHSKVERSDECVPTVNHSIHSIMSFGHKASPSMVQSDINLRFHVGQI